MKKILALCGSRNLESKGLEFLKEIKSHFNKKSDLQFEILTPNDYKLNPVSIGSKFFLTGKDDDDQKDDGAWLKNKILECDFLIVNSPVYSLNVSSDIKILIDRISPWSHIFRLLGKPGMTMTMGSGRGHLEVEAYLDHMFTSFGMNLIENLSFTNKKEFLKFDFEILVSKICKTIYEKNKFEVPLLLEMQYQEHKKIISKQPYSYFENKYWTENGLFDFTSLQEFVNYKNI